MLKIFEGGYTKYPLAHQFNLMQNDKLNIITCNESYMYIASAQTLFSTGLLFEIDHTTGNIKSIYDEEHTLFSSNTLEQLNLNKQDFLFDVSKSDNVRKLFIYSNNILHALIWNNEYKNYDIDWSKKITFSESKLKKPQKMYIDENENIIFLTNTTYEKFSVKDNKLERTDIVYFDEILNIESNNNSYYFGIENVFYFKNSNTGKLNSIHIHDNEYSIKETEIYSVIKLDNINNLFISKMNKVVYYITDNHGYLSINPYVISNPQFSHKLLNDDVNNEYKLNLFDDIFVDIGNKNSLNGIETIPLCNLEINVKNEISRFILNPSISSSDICQSFLFTNNHIIITNNSNELHLYGKENDGSVIYKGIINNDIFVKNGKNYTMIKYSEKWLLFIINGKIMRQLEFDDNKGIFTENTKKYTVSEYFDNQKSMLFSDDDSLFFIIGDKLFVSSMEFPGRLQLVKDLENIITNVNEYNDAFIKGDSLFLIGDSGNYQNNLENGLFTKPIIKIIGLSETNVKNIFGQSFALVNKIQRFSPYFDLTNNKAYFLIDGVVSVYDILYTSTTTPSSAIKDDKIGYSEDIDLIDEIYLPTFTTSNIQKIFIYESIVLILFRNFDNINALIYDRTKNESILLNEDNFSFPMGEYVYESFINPLTFKNSFIIRYGKNLSTLAFFSIDDYSINMEYEKDINNSNIINNTELMVEFKHAHVRWDGENYLLIGICSDLFIKYNLQNNNFEPAFNFSLLTSSNTYLLSENINKKCKNPVNSVFATINREYSNNKINFCRQSRDNLFYLINRGSLNEPLDNLFIPRQVVVSNIDPSFIIVEPSEYAPSQNFLPMFYWSKYEKGYEFKTTEKNVLKMNKFMRENELIEFGFSNVSGCKVIDYSFNDPDLKSALQITPETIGNTISFTNKDKLGIYKFYLISDKDAMGEILINDSRESIIYPDQVSLYRLPLLNENETIGFKLSPYSTGNIYVLGFIFSPMHVNTEIYNIITSPGNIIDFGSYQDNNENKIVCNNQLTHISNNGCVPFNVTKDLSSELNFEILTNGSKLSKTIINIKNDKTSLYNPRKYFLFFDKKLGGYIELKGKRRNKSIGSSIKFKAYFSDIKNNIIFTLSELKLTAKVKDGFLYLDNFYIPNSTLKSDSKIILDKWYDVLIYKNRNVITFKFTCLGCEDVIIEYDSSELYLNQSFIRHSDHILFYGATIGLNENMREYYESDSKTFMGFIESIEIYDSHKTFNNYTLNDQLIQNIESMESVNQINNCPLEMKNGYSEIIRTSNVFISENYTKISLK